MASRYEFSLKGIASDVQMGKGGGRFQWNSGSTEFRTTTNGATLANIAVADPTQANHAVTKQYLDAFSQGLDAKESVRVISTSNIALSGTQTIDGVSVVAGDRVLVAGQTTASENGIYDVAAGAWSRSSDADTTGEISGGTHVFVEEGSTYADTGWVCTSDGSPALNTDPITFVQFSSAGVIVAGTGLSKSGNTINLNIGATTITANGSNDVIVNSSATANQALLSSGTAGSEATWGALPIGDANAVTGVLRQVNGGLGSDVSGFAAESLIKIGASNTASEVAIGSNGNTLIVSSGAPTWGQLDLADDTNAVTGVLKATNGGTGQSTYAVGDVLVGAAGNTLSKVSIGTNNQVLTSDGTTAAWADPTPASGTVVTVRQNVTFSGGATQVFGSTIPANGIVVRVDMNVTSAFDTGTLAVSDSNGGNVIMTTAENDPTISAIFTSIVDSGVGASAVTPEVALTGGPTQGAATVTIHYIQP